MGEEIKSIEFDDKQDDLFLSAVQNETQWLEHRLKPEFFSYKAQHGYELEAYLIDQNGLPAPKNFELLNNINDPSFVHEIAKFNFEINGDILQRTPRLLQDFLTNIQAKCTRAKMAAEKLGLKSIFIGILPTLREDMLTLENMSPVNRYYALTERLIKIRKGKPIQVNISRNENLQLQRHDIMTEAAATSLQIHTQVTLEESLPFYNISQILAAPLLALSANSPFFLGKKLWDETRIPIFEQAVQLSDLPTENWPDPVTLGKSYCKKSLIELFSENHRLHPALLPVLFDEPLEKLRHLKLLNGQVWRWNRPIISTDPDNKIQLRIEHRPLPAGPTSVDMVANIAFYLGLLSYYSDKHEKLSTEISFQNMKDNFYSAAKLGMKAEVHWGSHGTTNMQKLLHDVLYDQAREGLKKLNIAQEDIQFFMHNILKPRIRTGFTGAAWQKSFIDTHGTDFQEMTLVYQNNQISEQPIHTWRV